MKVVLTRTTEAVAIDTAALPPHETDVISRTLIGCIGKLFEDPAVQADFKKWREERAKKCATNI